MKLPTAAAAVLVLLAAPAAVAQAPRRAVPAAADKPICKTSMTTGSLIAKRRECYTRADWNRINETQERGARLLQEGLMGRPCGGDACPGMGAQPGSILGAN